MEFIRFAQQEDAEIKAKSLFAWKVLIVDDEEDVHIVTKLALKNVSYQNKELEFYHAYSADEAITQLKEHEDIALIFMDVVMDEHDSGLKAIKHIRENMQNNSVRIIIRTGQPGYAPEKEVIKNYEINDYKEKAELTATKLYTSVISAIRSYHDITTLESLKGELEKAKHSVEAESRAKSMFLANISHELRTPLNGILGSLQVLRFDDIPPKMDRMLGMIEKSANILLDNISDIIDISKLETGKIEPAVTKFDFHDLISKNSAPYIVSAKAKGVQFNYEIAPEIPRIMIGDDGIVKRILLSMLSNAVKYTEEGEINLKIEKEFIDHADIRLKFTISDTGIGIEKEKQAQIFEPFVQGDYSYSKKYQGMGLGLSISKRFLEVLGGDIMVESDGKGSKFTFYVNMKIIV